MNRLRSAMLALAGLAALALQAADPAHAGVIENFRQGAWKGSAYTDDKTGAFSSCVATARYRSNIALSVQVDSNYNWALGFSSASWNMTVGKDIPLSYRIDRDGWQQGTGRVQFPNLVRMEMPDNGYIIRRFRRGNVMQIHDGNRSYSFKLTGTSRLMQRLARCVERNASRLGAGLGLGTPAQPGAPATGLGAPAQPAPPAQPPVQPTAQPAEPPANAAQGAAQEAALKVEAAQVLFNVMVKAAISGMTIVPDADMPATYEGTHALAGDDFRYLNVHIAEPGQFSSNSEILSLLEGVARKDCTDTFSIDGDTLAIDGKEVVLGSTLCSGGDIDVHDRTYVVARPKGGVYVIGLRETKANASDGEGDPDSTPPAPPVDETTLRAAIAAVAG